MTKNTITDAWLAKVVELLCAIDGVTCDGPSEKRLALEEGAIYTPPPPPRRGMTPQIRAAREKQKRDFEAWQDVWRAVRQAEKALDVEYEIAQMKDYY
jgi:hypothetical protein